MALLPVKRMERGSGELARLHRDMDDLLRGFFPNWEWPSWGAARWPVMDIGEQDDTYIIQAEVPGCKAEDIDVSVHGNALVISGEKKAEEKREDQGFHHIERSFGSFRRELTLAGEVDAGKIEASCTNGVLTIKLPKSEKAKPVKIKIKSQ
ncbi:MAG: Hsp20/alpha crystallin family protein [Phycisphaerales bacterium]|nr:MAG: Hsp20/alpha crystallin family protein [Phycisphaerales bacterium]